MEELEIIGICRKSRRQTRLAKANKKHTKEIPKC